VNSLGYTVLLIDFRSHGESSGSLVSFGWYERNDVLAARDYLRGAGYSSWIEIGYSMGGAASIFSGPCKELKGLVLISVYDDLRTTLKNRLKRFTGFESDLLARLILLQSRVWLKVGADDISVVNHVAEFGSVPVMILCGGKDRNVTLADSKRLAASVKNLAGMVEFSEVGHEDLLKKDVEKYKKAVGGFLERYF